MLPSELLNKAYSLTHSMEVLKMACYVVLGNLQMLPGW
jgi:hypothetical protein